VKISVHLLYYQGLANRRLLSSFITPWGIIPKLYNVQKIMKYAHINALRDNLVNIYIYSRLFNRVFTRAVELGFKNPGFSFF